MDNTGQYSCPVLSYVVTAGVVAANGGSGDDVAIGAVTTTGISVVALARLL